MPTCKSVAKLSEYTLFHHNELRHAFADNAEMLRQMMCLLKLARAPNKIKAKFKMHFEGK